MREIKFRLWDKLGNKIVTPNKNIYLNLLGQVVTDSPENGEIIPFSKDTYELNQSTGLQDVTGKDIYEGDILEFDEKEWGCKHIFEVKYDKYSGFVGSGTLRDWEVFCKIIGNIYENPEHLERGRGKNNN